MKVNKKIFTVFLMLILIISTTTSAFAMPEGIEPNSSSDRFRYEYETTPLTLTNSYTITAEQAASAQKAKDRAYDILETFGGSLGAVTSLTIQLGDAIYDMNGPGTMKVYNSYKTQYKVNLVTGNRSVVGKWRTVVFKLYNTSGTLYNTQKHTMREK